MFRRMVQAGRRLKIPRPRVATILVVIGVAILLAVLNRPYERVVLYDPDVPVGFIGFDIRVGPGGPHSPVRVDCCGWPWEMRYTEQFHRRPSRVFWSWSAVAMNLTAALATLVVVGGLLEARARRAKRFLQVTLADAAVMLLVCAIALGMISRVRQRADQERAAAQAISKKGWVEKAVRSAAWHKPLFDAYDGANLRRSLSYLETITSARLNSDEPELVTTLQACSQLEQLTLGYDDWEDLSFLSSFPHLTELTVTGNFDGEALDVLRHLPRLRELWLGSRNLDDGGLQKIVRHTNLYWLSLDGRFGDAGVKLIAEEDNLRGLQLTSPNVSDAGLAGIVKLENLEQLSLEINTKGNTLRGLSGHRALERLDLRGSRLETLRLEDIPNLVELRLPHKYSLKAIELINLPKLPRLPRENGIGYFVGPDDLRAKRVIVQDLPKLVELDVECSSDGDFHLAELPQLKRLRLRFADGVPPPPLSETASPDDRGIIQLKHLPALRRLDLSECPLNDMHLAEIAELSQLRKLDLAQTGTTDKGAAHLSRLRELKVLSLAHTNISDAALATFVDHPRLSELYLDGTDVTEKGLALLLDLPAISDLYVHDTKVNAAELRRMNVTRINGQNYVKAFVKGP